MRFVTLLFLFLFSTQIHSQAGLKEGLHLKNPKIVLLGEQTHGDGAVFDKKVELIKELHQKLGFNIVVFESGLYDNYKALQLFQEKKEDISIFYESVYPWRNDAIAFQELFDYVSKNPEMKIMGFDSQEDVLFKEYYINDLKSLLSKNNLNLIERLYTTLEKTIVYRDYDPYINNKIDSIALYKSFDKVREQFSKIKNKDFEAKIIEQTFISTVSDFDFNLKMAQKEKIFVQNPRDKQMAENLIFLEEQFPNEKFIGWGASYHFANKIRTFEYNTTTEKYISETHELTQKLIGHNEASMSEMAAEIKQLKSAIPMGQILKEHYGGMIYSIGFTSYEGNYLGEHEKEFPVLTPPENSIEILLNNEKSDSKLIDSTDFPEGGFYTSTLGYIPLFADWKIIFDGIYYIPKMYPPVNREYNESTDTIQIQQDAKVSGIVTENEFDNPVAYADVYYSTTNKSVITNNEGAFSIIKSVNSDDYLIFSALSYQSDSIKIKNIKPPLNIALQKTKNLIALNEVVVSGSQTLSAKDILKKARQKVQDNYIQTPFNQNLFYRVQAYQKDSLLFNEEAIIKTYFKKGVNGTANPESNITAEIQQFRSTTGSKRNNQHSGIGSLWVTLNRDVILSKTNVLYRTSAYELKKEGLVEYDGRLVYKISFVNISPGAFSSGYGYPAPLSSNGIIYIETETFVVLHYEHCVTRDIAESKKSKFKWQGFHKTIQTYKEVNGKYFINLFKVINKSNVYDKTNGEYLFNSYRVHDIMSEDIETRTVTPLKRPVRKLMQNVKLKKDSTFWETANFFLEDSLYQFESCE